MALSIASDTREWTLRLGVKLGSERLMVGRFGVSPATVRAAPRLLELQCGLRINECGLRINAEPRDGRVVSIPDAGPLASAGSHQLQFANATLKAVLDRRRSIYCVLNAEAAESASDHCNQIIEVLRIAGGRVGVFGSRVQAFSCEINRTVDVVRQLAGARPYRPERFIAALGVRKPDQLKNQLSRFDSPTTQHLTAATMISSSTLLSEPAPSWAAANADNSRGNSKDSVATINLRVYN